MPNARPVNTRLHAILRATLAAVLYLAPAGALSAQNAVRSDRVVQTLPTSYSDPLCDLKGTHWKTNAGINNLKSALETTDTAKRAKELDKGKALITEAIQQNKQDKSSTAWFALARVYLYQGDLAGADSALAKAHAISPKCAGMFEGLRYQLWAPLVNAAAEFAKAQANDSALALFHQAAAIYPAMPQAFIGAGVIFANTDLTDSAIVYFQQAAERAEQGKMTDERNQATYNLAGMLQRANRHQEAIAALEKYLQWKPDDLDAKRALAVSYQAAGQTAKAQALNAELVAAGAAGAAGKDPSNGGSAAAVNDALRLAISYYNAKNWAEAAKAFERVVALAPYHRDARYGLASSYLGLNDAPKLVAEAEKLAELDPLNADVLALLGTGYRTTKQQDKALDIAQRLFGLPVSVAVETFSVAADSATVNGTATGRAAQTEQGKPIPPAPITLVFEFLGADGAVLATADATIPPLKQGETSKFSAQATGKGIVGWRYRRK